MNCKPGDLAILVASDIGKQCDIGKIVEVLRPYDGYGYEHNGFGWWVMYRGGEYHCADKHLRPIRPGSEDTTTEREVEHAA